MTVACDGAGFAGLTNKLALRQGLRHEGLRVPMPDSRWPPEARGQLIRGISPPTGERRAMLRAAVIQVVRHLVLRAVPPARRVPLFDQATSLVEEAGWGLDELAAATEPGPARDALFRTLGLGGDS